MKHGLVMFYFSHFGPGSLNRRFLLVDIML